MENARQAHGRRRAPGELRGVESFVNTLDVAKGTDDLERPDQLTGWLALHGLAAGTVQADSASVKVATEVREAIRELLLANNHLPSDHAAAAVIGRAWEQAHLRIVMDEQGPRLLPQEAGVSGALGALLVAMFEAMVRGTWTRLKACHDERCQQAFYDHSKNRSGKWCAMARCGNRAKARTYRGRRPSGRTVS